MAAISSYLKSNLQGGRSLQLASSLLRNANRFAALSGSSSRAVHSAPADNKNLDDGVSPAAQVPDDVIGGSHKYYWEPNPATGVFGPASASDHHQQLAAAPPVANANPGGTSGLDDPAWFRATDGVDC